MKFIPFFLDFSREARLIRRIKPGHKDIAALEVLCKMTSDSISSLSVDHLSAIWTRSEKALPMATDPREAQLLDLLLRNTRWAVQDWHRKFS